MLVALLPACGLVLYGNLEQQKLEKETMRQQAIASVKLAAASQERYISNAEHLLSTLTDFAFLTLTTNRAFAEMNLRNLRLLSPDYADFGLIEADGRLFCCAAVTNELPATINFGVQKEVMKSRRFCVGRLEPDNLAHIPTLRVGYPVYATNGVLQRVIYASIRLNLLSQALTNIAVTPGTTMSVLDRDGNFIARYPGATNWVGKNARGEAFAQELFRNPGRTFEATGLDGQQRLYASTTVSDGREPVLFLTVGIPTQMLYAHANRVLLRNSIALLVVGALALLGASMFARELFLKPVNAIVAAARRLAAGDYSARTGLPQSKDELHALAKDFDSMAEAMARHQSQLKEANQKILKLNAELEQRVAQRTAQLEATISELEAFSYSVSHDLRAPLRHLDGFAQILAGEPALAKDERVQRYLGLITKSAKKMGLLIDDLLNFSRIGRQTLAVGSVEIDTLLPEVIADFKQEQEGRSIEWTIHKLPVVNGDTSMLRQVWVNLISNALKYTRGRNPAKIEIGARDEGSEYVFCVRDNGAGFEMQYADKLFGVFQRLHRDEEFEGTGIGLANVRRVIMRHNGRTWAEAELDKGAAIYFSLPKRAPQGAYN
jgi:signal transduction histidine kinase